jgi:tetratricopeptide (TPR) repeat protein
VAVQFLKFYTRLFGRLTFGASRLQEVLADRLAVRCYGAAAFRDGLTHVIRRAVEFDLAWSRAVRDAVQSPWPAFGFYRPAEAPELADREQVETVVTALLERETDATDSHPSPKDRFALAARVAAPSPPPSPERAWDLLADNVAVLLEMSGQFDEAVAAEAAQVRQFQGVAVEVLSAQLQARPHPQGFFERAQVSLDRGDYETAVADLGQILEAVPDAAAARYARAVAYQKLGQHARALADLGQVVKQVPAESLADDEFFRLYLALGQCLAREGRFQEAAWAFSKALAKQPKSLVALVERGRTYRELRAWDDALADFAAARRHWPAAPEPYLEQALVREAGGQCELADQDRDAAWKLDRRVGTGGSSARPAPSPVQRTKAPPAKASS